MMTPIKGDFSKIFLNEFGSTSGDKLIGCTTGDTFNDTTEMAEITGLTSDFAEFVPTYKSGTLTTDAMLIYTDGGDAQYSTQVLLEWSAAKTKLTFIYQFSDGVTDSEIDGICYINSLSINAPANDFASVQIGLQCSGQWNLTF